MPPAPKVPSRSPDSALAAFGSRDSTKKATRLVTNIIAAHLRARLRPRFDFVLNIVFPSEVYGQAPSVLGSCCFRMRSGWRPVVPEHTLTGAASWVVI